MASDELNLLRRIERLERQDRSLKIAFGLLVVLVIGSLAWMRASSWGKIEAQQFTVTDKHGTRRATLGIEEFRDSGVPQNSNKPQSDSPAGPALSMYDRDGKRRVRLVLFSDFPELAMGEVAQDWGLNINAKSFGSESINMNPHGLYIGERDKAIFLFPGFLSIGDHLQSLEKLKSLDCTADGCSN